MLYFLTAENCTKQTSSVPQDIGSNASRVSGASSGHQCKLEWKRWEVPMYLSLQPLQRWPDVHVWLSHWLLPCLKRKHVCWRGDSAGKGAFHKCVRVLVQTPRNHIAGRCAVHRYNYSISIGRWEAETREFPEVLGSSCLASTTGMGVGQKSEEILSQTKRRQRRTSNAVL